MTVLASNQDDDASGETTLAGIARRASVEIVSPVSGKPCLLFGVRGSAGVADVADADGGDFDLELPSGERVMVSLEHARLVVAAGADADAHADADAEGAELDDLLLNRGISGVAPSELEEYLVREGDEVVVTGTLLGGTVTSSLGAGHASRARVIAGREERPLVVEASRRHASRS